MWRVASEAYAYLAGHPFLTDTFSSLVDPQLLIGEHVRPPV